MTCSGIGGPGCGTAGDLRDNDHSVHIDPGTQPAARRIRAFLLRNLAGVDPDELVARLKTGGFDALPVWTFEDEGVRLQVQPIPKSEALRGQEGVRPIGVYAIESRYGSVTRALRAAISDKAARCGDLEQPFIIAVNSISEWGTDRIDTMQALFGTEQFVFSVEGPREPQMIRARDGVFLGPHGPQCTRVSGALFSRILPWNVPHAWLELYHNPWAARPITQDLLPVDQAVPDGEEMRFLGGHPLHRVFALPEQWPYAAVGSEDD